MTHGESQSISLGSASIGKGARCFVVAEAGVNHNGDLGLARALIDAAAEAEADAVKFQTFRADRVVGARAAKAAYQQKTTDAGESQQAMLHNLELGRSAHEELIAHARARGILFLSTPFDIESARLLVELGLPLLKIPSGEVTNLPFLERLGEFGLPVLLSTGMSTLDEVDVAVRTLRKGGVAELALFHCVSCYPTSPADANLRAMETLRTTFGVPVGFSDHTIGTHVALAAVALGAELIEKHLTVDTSLPGPDHAASMEPDDFARMVREIREVESAFGTGIKQPVPAEANVKDVARRSLVSTRDIAKGTRIGEDDIVALRPGTGIPPADQNRILGRIAACDIPADALLEWEMLA